MTWSAAREKGIFEVKEIGGASSLAATPGDNDSRTLNFDSLAVKGL